MAIQERNVSGLLTGGPRQLQFEGLERAAEEAVSAFSLLSTSEKAAFAEMQPNLFDKTFATKYSRFNGEVIIYRHQPLSNKRKKELERERQGQQKVKIRVGRRPTELIPQGYPTIEHAIGSRVHILEKYQPTKEGKNQNTQIQKFEDVLEQIDTLISMFESGQITRVNLAEQGEQVYRLLETHGFLRTRVPNRQEAIEQLLNAVDLDSIGRLNPLISRMRLASATTKWMIELYIGDMTISKNQTLLLALIQERSLERFYIESVVQKATDYLTGEPSREGRTELFDVVLELFRHNTIKTAPYRIPAFRLLFGAFGIPDSQSSGLGDLYENMFGPDSKEPITNLRQIKADYWSNNRNAQRRFVTNLETGIQALKEALAKGEEKFGEYTLIIPTLVANGKK